MIRVYGVLMTVLMAAVIMIGCSSDGTKEAKSILRAQTSVTEAFVKDLEGAKSSDDVAAAIENYTEGMKKIIPEMKAFEENYPDFKKGEESEEMQAEGKRLEEASTKLPAAMMKVAGHMMDSKVQAAMQAMTREMQKLQ